MIRTLNTLFVTLFGLGKVSKITDQYIELSISENTKIKIQKTSISAVLPKGTLKSI